MNDVKTSCMSPAELIWLSSVHQPFDPGGKPIGSLKQYAGETADSVIHGSHQETWPPTTKTMQPEYRMSFVWSPVVVLLVHANDVGNQPSGRSKGRPTSPDPGGGAYVRSRPSHVITASLICNLFLILCVFVQHICSAIQFAGARIPPRRELCYGGP